jgi:NADPH2:quinone reductase
MDHHVEREQQLMRAWTVREFGPFQEALHLEQLPRPCLGPGSAVGRVSTAGINFQDTLLIAGRYQVRPQTPFVPGFEVVAEVVEVGETVRRFRRGDRVIASIQTGGYAEYVLLDIERTFPAPVTMTDDEAAAFMLSYQTAYFALVHRAKLRPGEVLLVHAGAGGVGSASIQIGKALGATVVATAGSNEKVSACRRVGADHSINYAEQDFVDEVRDITSGAGADVIIDPVGGDVFSRSTKCIAWQGRIVVVGFASNEIPTMSLHRVLLKNIAVVGIHWSGYCHHDPALVRETQEVLNELFAAGKIRPMVGHRYRMEELPQALEAFEHRTICGKAVLVIGARCSN